MSSQPHPSLERASWPYASLLSLGIFGANDPAGKKVSFRGGMALVLVVVGVLVLPVETAEIIRLLGRVAIVGAAVLLGWANAQYPRSLDELSRPNRRSGGLSACTIMGKSLTFRRHVSDQSMPDRTYSQEEVAALFERAGELHSSAWKPQDAPGLTLGELEQIAAEAGMEPSLLRHAAAELDAPARPMGGRRSGATATHVYTERWVTGALTPELWENVVAELRHRFDTSLGPIVGSSGGKSSIEQVGRTVEWNHTSLGGIETRVLMQPQGDQVRIRVNQRVGLGSTMAEAVLYGSVIALFIGLVSSAIVHSLTIGALVALVTFLAAAPLFFAHDTRWRQKKHVELEDLADWLAEQTTRLGALESKAGADGTDEGLELIAEHRLSLNEVEQVSEPDDLLGRARQSIR